MLQLYAPLTQYVTKLTKDCQSPVHKPYTFIISKHNWQIKRICELWLAFSSGLNYSYTFYHCFLCLNYTAPAETIKYALCCWISSHWEQLSTISPKTASYMFMLSTKAILVIIKNSPNNSDAVRWHVSVISWNL